jgi:hypothetical protein
MESPKAMAETDARAGEVERLRLILRAETVRIEALEGKIRRVREIHEPIDAVMFAGGGQHARRVCTGCGTDDGNWQVWPCPTIRALDGDS